jgi:hypothetical protein
MQYVKKNIYISDSVKNKESYENMLYSKNENNLSTHISNTGPSAISASRAPAVEVNSQSRTQDLFCKIVSSSALPIYQLSPSYRKIINLLIRPGAFKKDYFRSPEEKILIREKLIPGRLFAYLAQYTLYLPKKTKSSIRRLTPYYPCHVIKTGLQNPYLALVRALGISYQITSLYADVWFTEDSWSSSPIPIS